MNRRAGRGPGRATAPVPRAAQLDDPARRDAYVAEIFDLIAPRYDRFTRWFSYGMDAAWKRELRRLAAAALGARTTPGDPLVLDLACGTGDLAIAVQSCAPRGTFVGLDISQPMLEHAKRRARAEAPPPAAADGGIRFVAADMTRLPIASASAALVTAGYGLRNAPRLGDALDEIRRVLQPGGHVVTLDFFLPAWPVWRTLFLGYLAVAGWIYGWLWHRRPDAYVYIPRSIRRFVTAATYEAELRVRGFEVIASRRRLLGAVVVHAARLGR